ncbi:MAG TPA: helix-turn-helix domain-containing protein [Nitrososphaerales archaeon]|nr:helix-turn-helix domain-containing protein [Nitrososphaerales archaeon]
MINPYEMVSRSALPALRAMVAKRMQEEYHLTQQQVARRLGVTQASISNYARRTRGSMFNFETDPTVSRAADKIAGMLSSKKPDELGAVATMTEICDYIRFSRLMCSLHEDLEPGYNVNDCAACEGVLTGKGFQRLIPAVG